MSENFVIKNKHDSIQFVQFKGHSCILRCFENKEQLTVYRTLSELSCEYLPEIFNIEETDSGFNVWEEFIDGLTLEDYTKEKGCLNEKEILNIALQLSKAIDAIHNAQIIHRDIKPSNVMITCSGRVVLIDFNVARLYSDENKSKDTRLLGTEGYAAPEQYGYTQTDFRTDYYGLGATLYELRNGKTPDGRSKYKGRLKKPIKKCLSFNPDDRYNNAKKFRIAMFTSYYRRFLFVLLMMVYVVTTLWNGSEFTAQSSDSYTEIPYEQVYGTPVHNPSERIFQGEEIYVWRVLDTYIDLSSVPLNKDGFNAIIESEYIKPQIEEALGKKYDTIIRRYSQGVSYFSYDETNGIYFAKGPLYAWEITCGGTVHIAYIDVERGVEEIKVWEYTNETRQACGEEMKDWFIFADDYIKDATYLFDEMNKIAREQDQQQ